MGLNDTPRSERIHIALLGRVNSGKSGLFNAFLGQEIAVVSDIEGTTTDPVYKSIELVPLGPAVLIDTPGIDDNSVLGEKRMEKSFDIIRKIDLALVVKDAVNFSSDSELIEILKKQKIPYIEVYTKSDLIGENEKEKDKLYVSSKTLEGISELKEKINSLIETSKEKSILGDLVERGDYCLLVIPIDKSAPKGRLILPEQMVIRDLLDNGAIPVITRDSELENVIGEFGEKISLVITDSQAFKRVAEIVPKNIRLTSFSILLSRYKGELESQLKSLKKLKELEDGDKILIAEGCTHHVQCGDIGREKIPKAIEKYTGKKLNMDFSSGQEFPKDLEKYSIIIHCGGCMLNEKEMKYRINKALKDNIPITNYGMVLALATGVLERSIEPFKKAVCLN